MSPRSELVTASVYVALVIGSLSIGYYTGTRSSRARKSSSVPDDSPSDLDNADDYKLALVVRSDLGMSVGKIAAQCSHATLACYQTLQVSDSSALRKWERSGQPKITLRCDSEDELLLLQAQARSLDLCARSIQDAGRTQIVAGSRTVLGIGPGPAKVINMVTSRLRLL